MLRRRCEASFVIAAAAAAAAAAAGNFLVGVFAGAAGVRGSWLGGHGGGQGGGAPLWISDAGIEVCSKRQKSVRDTLLFLCCARVVEI